MRRGLGRRTGAAAVIVLGALVALPASPAAAEPVITIDAPVADAVSASPSVAISGKVVSSAPLLNVPRRVTLTVEGRSPFTVECTTASCPFRWTPRSFDANGPYGVTVSATEGSRLLGVDGDTATATRSFAVAAPATRPVVDPPKVTEGRTVELSWSRSPEPDILYYAVFRKDPGGSKFVQVSNKVNQSGAGTKPIFTDSSTSAFGGGDYAYQVVAVRKGATGNDKSEVKSEPSAIVSASVPVPPSTTSSTAPAAPGSPAGGPNTTAKPAPPGGVDLSSFLSSRSQPIALPTITVPEPPDTGFLGSLPFGARPPGEELEEGEAEAVPPSGSRSSSIVSLGGGRPLVPVAGGLVLLLLALHMRLLGRRVKSSADADLPLDLAAGPPASASPAPAAPAGASTLRRTRAPAPIAVAPRPPAAEPEPERQPEPTVYDIGNDPGAEADWAPAAPEPVAVVSEPEPAAVWAPPTPEPEPEPTSFDPDAIEVFEVVSSSRRRLVRVGDR